jgi:hypothetical protein
MSLKIRRITLANFRKFREPFVLDGLTDGLNVIIEPNETGKSTLLEAMRAAFFIRHNTANRLARSYAPHGEAVAPQIEVGFEARGEDWQVNKRFLKGASVEVRGPNGRAQGEDAEAQLQALLGARRDTSQAGDAAAHGALGLLWVGQAQALEVTAPGDIVRDSVRATLEPTSVSGPGSTASSQTIGLTPAGLAVARRRHVPSMTLPRALRPRRPPGSPPLNKGSPISRPLGLG